MLFSKMPIKIKILRKVKTCHKNLKYPLICQLICLWGVKFLFNQYQSLWLCFLSKKSLKPVKDVFLGHPVFQFLRNPAAMAFKIPKICVNMPAEVNCHDPPSRRLLHVTKVINNWLQQHSTFIIFHYSTHH